MSKYRPDSRGWWRRAALTKQHVLDVLKTRITELETDYDVVETELRERITTCTCGKDTKWLDPI